MATAASSKPLASVSETVSRARSSAALPYSGNLHTSVTHVQYGLCTRHWTTAEEELHVEAV